MDMQKIQIRSVKLGVATLSTMVLLVCSLFPFKIYAGCAYSEIGRKVVCNNIGRGEPSSSSSSNSQANTQAALGAVQSAIGIWAEASQKQAAEREANERAEKQQRRNQFNRDVDMVKDDADVNPWANSNSDKKDKKQDKRQKSSDIYLGTCVEQNFSSQSNGQFVLKNTCNYAINLKYIFSSSKPFSGAYTTLQPNQMTFETGKQGETIRFNVCPVPQIPQTLDGGCI